MHFWKKVTQDHTNRSRHKNIKWIHIVLFCVGSGCVDSNVEIFLVGSVAVSNVISSSVVECTGKNPDCFKLDEMHYDSMLQTMR